MTSVVIESQPSFSATFRTSARGKRIEKWLEEWFSSGHVEHRSEQTLEREKYVLWAPWSGLYNRYMVILPIMIVQICAGSLYSWSIFNSPMDKIWGTPGINANAFTIAVALFGASALVFGNWIERNGPFWTVNRTLWLTPAGWALCALGSWLPNYGVVYLGQLLHGMGAGHAYISLCSCAQRWFPEFKGFATGLAVMFFGVGSFIWTSIGRTLLDPKGDYKMLSYQVQGIFAGVYFGAIALSLPFLRNPPPDFTPDTAEIAKQQNCAGACLRTFAGKSKHVNATDRQFRFLEAVLQPEFGLLCLFVFCQFITGVVFLSSASDMVKNVFKKSAEDANFVTSMLNLSNFCGRFAFGYLSDRIGRKTFYLIATAWQAFAVGLMAVWIDQQNYGAWLLSFLSIGAFYGGGFGVLPAFVSDMFGPKISAATHGVTISVWSLASIVGIPIFTSFTSKYSEVINGVKIPQPQAYIYNSYWLCGLPALGFVLMTILNTNQKDQQLRKAFNALRIRVCGWVCQIKCLSAAQQAEEWEAYQAAKKVEDIARAAHVGSTDGSKDKDGNSVHHVAAIVSYKGHAGAGEGEQDMGMDVEVGVVPLKREGSTGEEIGALAASAPAASAASAVRKPSPAASAASTGVAKEDASSAAAAPAAPAKAGFRALAVV